MIVTILSIMFAPQNNECTVELVLLESIINDSTFANIIFIIHLGIWSNFVVQHVMLLIEKDTVHTEAESGRRTVQQVIEFLFIPHG